MRHRRHLRRGASRKKKDWVILAHTDCLQEMPSALPCQAYAFSEQPDLVTTFSTSLINGADLTEKEDSLTIVRIVGEVEHLVQVVWDAGAGVTTPSTLVFQIDEMIYKSTGGDIVGGGEYDPRFGVNMELDTILWRRRLLLVATLSNSASGTVLTDLGNGSESSPGMGPHLDIRTMRKLKQGDELVYSAAALRSLPFAGSTEATSVFWKAAFNLRGFVKF